ncbi:4-hydroxy-tetrahydrodipicolinate reductase [Williamwhitmania taraxaci]|uniref:4-hydroxy-tetrahydrodipicolinate reductase n=1 Tax=Williamwhitmania taraxaci TaxID=1640674 RepID=A0A1G6P6L8_9BACT|nr:4-hydroxy-tetrahydrodipicolinate reductase [Williamwhitmania taraxaci]SDC75842.1 dihydrodipicolinate reductase [Williamwhitmania taraxaci]
MKIALIGYGKMGREIEAIAMERNHQVVLTIDKENFRDLTTEKLSQADVAIEFTSPHTAFTNVSACFKAGVPVVSGSTGWMEQLSEAEDLCKKMNAGFFYASNYSVGVNIYLRVNKLLASIMAKTPGYSLEIEETHHIQKLDAPSGTAITLADVIAAELPEKIGWTMNPAEKDDHVFIKSVREGNVPGVHSVSYSSNVDEITFTHAAKNRKGLALGAILAAEFMVGRKGIYGMNDLLNL